MSPTAVDAQAIQDAHPGLRWIVMDTCIGFTAIPCMAGVTSRRVLACMLSADTLDGLRAKLPGGLARSERRPADADLVEETWQ